MDATELSYSTKKINRDYRIKVFGITTEGNKINILVGVSGLLNLIGADLTNKFLTRAYNNLNDDKTICKLRRGLKVTFYNK